jgi:DNA invertase Pin-like site-specific DNA recombinase
MSEQVTKPSIEQKEYKEPRNNARHKEEEIEGIRVGLYKKLVKEVGHPIKRKVRTNVKFALKMFDAGWSFNQIGKHFKVSGCTVRRRLKEAGLLK